MTSNCATGEHEVILKFLEDVGPVFVKRVGPIPVAARSKSWVCGRSIAGIEVSNPAEGIDFRVLCFLLRVA